MQKIIPHLWFDKEAKEAAEFYVSIFPNSKIMHSSILNSTPSGSVDVVHFEIDGYQIQSLSAGPMFKLNPSISFFVNFDPSRDEHAREKLTMLWEKLSEGGTALMPLQEYPFSKWYGWIQDRFGVTWQLILTNPTGEPRPFIVPSLLFTGAVTGKAEEAQKFYQSVFQGSKQGNMARYPAGMEPDKEGTLMFSDFQLEHQWFAAMDSAHPHKFAFNEALSFIVECKDQAEVDYFWEKMSAVPASEQCGWIKDKYGVSWQIIPTEMEEMFKTGNKEQVARLTQAMLQMHKLDVAALRKAFEG